MAVRNGDDIVLYIGTKQIGGEKNVTIKKSRGIIEVSAKGDDSRQLLPGRLENTVELEAFMLASDSAYDDINSAIDAGSSVTVKKYVNASPVASATAYITDLSENYPDMEGASYSLTLEITGAWV